MLGSVGLGGSDPRVVEHGPAAGSPGVRSHHDLRFADGGTLELGRRTVVMGVINATPDSFSDGDRLSRPEVAAEAASRMVRAGAELIDVGGESSRPGAKAVPDEIESRRVVPVIEAIKRRVAVRVSVDTTKPAVARRAFDGGADLLNDVSALADPRMLRLLADRKAPVVLMHMRGTPKTMQADTRYDDLIGEVVAFLEQRARLAAEGGVADDKIVVDPGFGFGKSVAGNLALLRRLPELAAAGRPLLVGASRKSFIGRVLDLPVQERLEGSLAVAAFAGASGAHIVRAHDVEATVRVVRMIDAIRAA